MREEKRDKGEHHENCRLGEYGHVKAQEEVQSGVVSQGRLGNTRS